MKKYEKLKCFLEVCKDFGWKPNEYLYTRNHNLRRDWNGKYVLAKKFLCKDEPYINITESDTGVYDWSDNGKDDEFEIYLKYNTETNCLSFPLILHTLTVEDNVCFNAMFFNWNLSYIPNKETFENILRQCEEHIAQFSKHIKDYQMKVREQKMKKDF